VDTCLRSVSAFFRPAHEVDTQVETRRIQVSALSPLSDNSDIGAEVLRLGLVGADPRISITACCVRRNNLRKRTLYRRLQNGGAQTTILEYGTDRSVNFRHSCVVMKYSPYDRDGLCRFRCRNFPLLRNLLCFLPPRQRRRGFP